MDFRQLDQRFFIEGDVGRYYATQVDGTSTLWWYAEHPAHEWAHVFRGQLSLDKDPTFASWDGLYM